MSSPATQGSSSANIITCKLYHGGNLQPRDDVWDYEGGSCVEGTLDICQFTLTKVDKLIEKFCGHQNASCFYRTEGGLQFLSGDETMEELIVLGVTHGSIELFFVEDDMTKNKTNVDKDPDDDDIEEICWSEPEEVVEEIEADTSDDEFIEVQEMKRQWISQRNQSGKKQVMKEKENELQEQRAKGLKDDYWEEDDDDDLEAIHEGEDIYERDSDDEGPLNPSDDDENPKIPDKTECAWYNPETPFGAVQIELGQLFDSVEVLRKALIYYTCQTRNAWNYYHNEPNRVLVKCKFHPKCKWKLSARYTKEYECLHIRFFKDIHTCAPTKVNKRANAIFLADEYREKLLKHPTWKLKLFMRDVEDTYGLKISRWQASGAKKSALSACGKVVEKQYASLRDYMYELMRSNEGVSVFLALKPHIPRSIPQFHMFYINFPALRKGFLNGCRRVLGLAGAFLKGYCKGELLSATARDANNQMFPVAWAVVESESIESWSWFLGHLINDLDMRTGKQWTFLSDQQKGLLPAIAKLLPDGEHRLCARHIFTNWIKTIKGAPLHKLYWKAVKAYTEEGFNEAMNELKQRNPKANSEMCSKDVTRFCRSFYKKWACTGVTCNNMAEKFNSWILEAREKPILTMLEEIRRKVMSRMVEKKAQAFKCNGVVTARVRATINDHMQATRNWRAIEADEDVYEVEHIHNSGLTFAVRLNEKKCSCRYWDVNGIPCEHATTAICAKNENPETYAAFWYSKDAYKTIYASSLEPLNGQNMWKKVDDSKIKPSDPRVEYGRPANKRKRAYGETRRKASTYRLPKNGKQVCSFCKESGHNNRTCKYRVPVIESDELNHDID